MNKVFLVHNSEKCQKDLKDEFRPQFWSDVEESEVSLNILYLQIRNK